MTHEEMKRRHEEDLENRARLASITIPIADRLAEITMELQRANLPPRGDRCISLAITDLQSAENWLRRFENEAKR